MLNEDQETGLTQLNDFIKEHILKTNKHHTKNQSLFKTVHGYSLYRICHLSSTNKCKSRWTLKIDMFTGEAQLSCDEACDHFNSKPKSPKGLFYKFCIYFFFNIDW